MPPTIDEALIKDSEKAYHDAANELERYSNVTSMAKNISDDFSNTLGIVKNSLNSITDFSNKSASELALFSTAILGVRKNFEGLNGIDMKGLNLFRNQYEDLLKIIKESPIGSVIAEKARASIASLAAKGGASKEEVSKIMSAPVEMISKLSGAFIDSADNGLKFTNVMTQLAGKTGNLGKLYNMAGKDFENFNLLLKQQGLLLSDVAEANQLPIQTINEYYAALGTIPGALNAVVTSSESASSSFDMITSAIKLAKGSGRAVEDITEDMRVAYKNYNMTTGDDFLEFSAKMTELNNKFGGSFDVVKDALRSLSSDFVMFGNNAESATKILNNYVGGLQATGLSGDASVKIVQDMTKSITGLSVAQRAFLSAQSGGPGGLMGAYKIEDMMRKGKSSEVMDMYIKQIQKLSGGGKMVTVEEASRSQSAAAQLTKQTQLLQSFGIGKGSEAEAHRIIEGLRKRQDGVNDGGELTKNFGQELMRKGTQAQQFSTTDFSQMRAELEGIRVLADITNFDVMKQTMSAHVGRQGESTTAAQVTHRNNLRNIQETAAIRGGQGTKDLSTPLSGVTGNENYLTGKVKKTINTVSDISPTSYIDGIKNAYGIKPTQSKIDQEKLLRSNIHDSINKQRSDGVNIAANRSVTAGMKRIHVPGSDAPDSIRSSENEQMRNGRMGELTVHVNGYCIKCKRDIEGGQQAAAVNPVGVRT